MRRYHLKSVLIGTVLLIVSTGCQNTGRSLACTGTADKEFQTGAERDIAVSISGSMFHDQELRIHIKQGATLADAAEFIFGGWFTQMRGRFDIWVRLARTQAGALKETEYRFLTMSQEELSGVKLEANDKLYFQSTKWY